MDDVKLKLNHIQPVGGQRPSGRAQAKDPALARKWEQTLQEANAQMESVSKNLNGTVRGKAPADPQTIQDELRQANEQFQQMMRLHQNLAQLYHQIHKSDSEKA